MGGRWCPVKRRRARSRGRERGDFLESGGRPLRLGPRSGGAGIRGLGGGNAVGWAGCVEGSRRVGSRGLVRRGSKTGSCGLRREVGVAWRDYRQLCDPTSGELRTVLFLRSCLALRLLRPRWLQMMIAIYGLDERHARGDNHSHPISYRNVTCSDHAESTPKAR